MLYYYINSQFLPPEKALVSADDRGFRFGDGVFETIPIHDSLPYLWEAHMQRLEAGLKALRITFEITTLSAAAHELIAKNELQTGLLRIAISRGIGSQGYLPVAGQQSPTVVMQLLYNPPPVKEVSLWHSTYEKISARALPVQCKLAQGVNQTLARLEASEQGCNEALQLNAQGYICEASAANIFWLKEGALYTPSLDCGILAGVTRSRMIELSPYPVKHGAYKLAELQAAEGVILTNAARGIMAVGSLEPEGFSWSSGALSERFSALRKEDITNMVRRPDNSLP